MANIVRQHIHPFVIRCKRCGECFPAPVNDPPPNWIIATCPLCSERRRYLPIEIFAGVLSNELRRRRLL